MPRRWIAILRAGSVEHFLAGTPALRALRAAYPQARISLLTAPELHDLAFRYEIVDEVVSIPPCPGVRSGSVDEARLKRFFEHQKESGYDLALQLHGDGRCPNDFVLSLGAEETAGFGGGDATLLDYWVPFDPLQHEILRPLDVLGLLGVPPGPLVMEFPIRPADRSELAEALRQALAKGTGRRDSMAHRLGGRWLAVHLGATVPERQWPPNRWAQVADALLDASDLAGVLLLAGRTERLAAAEYLAATRHPARTVDLSGRLSLGGLAAAIGAAALFLGNDGAAASIAQAIGTPSAVVFAIDDLAVRGPLTRTFHRPVVPTAYAKRGDPDTAHQGRVAGGLLTIHPQDVIDVAGDLLRLVVQHRATPLLAMPRSDLSVAITPQQLPNGMPVVH